MARKPSVDRMLATASVRLVHARRSPGIGPAHAHDEAMIFVPLSGALRFAIDGETHVADAQHALAVRGATTHRHEANDEVEYLVAYIDDGLLGCIDDATPGAPATRALRFANTVFVRELAGELLAELSGTPDPEIIAAISRLLAAQVARGSRGRVDVTAPLPADERLAKAIGLARQRYRQGVSTAELAKVAGMSPRTFERALVRACGTTPRQLVEQLRLADARDRLATGRETVTAVAFDLGYKSLSHFVRRFRLAFGTTPTGVTDVARRASRTSRAGAANTTNDVARRR